MREVREPQVGPSGAQQPGDERDMEILDQHDVTRHGDRRRRVGERRVDPPVRVPCLEPATVEARPAGQVEEPVEPKSESEKNSSDSNIPSVGSLIG